MSYREQEIKRIAETKDKLKVRGRKLGAGLNASSLSIKNIGYSNVGSQSIQEEADEDIKSEDAEESDEEVDELDKLDIERKKLNNQLTLFKVRSWG